MDKIVTFLFDILASGREDSPKELALEVMGHRGVVKAQCKYNPRGKISSQPWANYL